MLGPVPGLQPSNQSQNHQQQPPQQQQGPQNPNLPPPPPPPPLNGQDINLSNILHFLQSEWRRYERDRNEWEIERAEMRARIALLEGERRSFENTRIDLLRRIKMLEYALRMERSKQLNQPSSQSIHPSKVAVLQSQSNPSSHKDDSGSHKGGGSNGSSPRSEDVPLPPDNRMSIASFSGLPNGGPVVGPTARPHTWAGPNWPSGFNGSAPPVGPLGKPPPGRDPKSRARSRDYLKQCLQEISYLTSPQAMNPLPNRPLLNNPTLPLALPNVPSFEMAYNGRPRKIVPEVGKEYPVLNGMNMMGGPASAPASSTSQGPLLERDGRLHAASGVPLHQPPSSQQTAQGQASNFHQQQPPIGQTPPEVQPQPLGKDRDAEDTLEPQQLTAIFRPDNAGEWKERLRLSHEAAERARVDKSGQSGSSGSISWEGQPKEEDDEAKDDETEVEDDEAHVVGENDGKIWRPRRTLRNHLDAVRALAFHPTEMCLATGGDDCTVKIWRMDVASLAAAATRATTEVEPQLTLRGHTAAITRLIHSPSKRLLYSASLDSSIRVWSLPSAAHTTYAPYDSSHARGDLIGHTDAVWDLALIRDENVLVSCGAEGAVKVWDVSGMPGSGSLKLSWGFSGLENEDEENSSSRLDSFGATALEAIKTDLKQVAVAYQNAVIKLFDVDSGQQLSRLQSDFSQDGSSVTQVNRIASHPTMPFLVTAHEDKFIRIFDIITGQCTHSIVAHLDSVTSLSVDVAGFSLVSGGHDCSIRFWDLLGTRACVQEVSSHREKAREGVLDVEFHSSLPFMASAGADGVIKLYASSQ